MSITLNGTSGITSPGGDIVSGNLLFNSGYGSAATAYGCRAWVNFNGTGTVAIRASGNVSSITDNGTGNYTINFTTALSDANYSAISTAGTYTALTANPVANSLIGTQSTSAVQVGTTSGSTASTDYASISVAVFR